MRDTNRLLSVVFVLVAASAATPLGAQPPAPSGMSAAKSTDKADSRALKADDKAGKGPHKFDRADDKAALKDEKGAAKDAAKVEKTAARPEGSAGNAPDPAASGMRAFRRHEPGGYRGLGVEFHRGGVSKEQLKERMEKMQAARAERRKEHRLAVRQRWGTALAHPALREELRHHARREAFLTRALFVAQTEPVKNKEKIIARIEKLIEREDERHAKAMERLRANPNAAASASAAPSAAAPASSALTAPSAKVPAPAHSAKAGAK
jgi:hypothetical protein